MINAKKSMMAILVAAALSGGCATPGQNGQNETSAVNTAALGAGLGALAGQLIGGNTKSTLIGAAIGGGVGYLVGLDARKKELAAAQAAAAEIKTEASFLKPVVYSQTLQNAQGEKAEGLKSIDVDLPIAEMTSKNGDLNDKGKAAMIKLQAVADRTGTMEIIVPRNLKSSTFVALTQAAPRAKVIVGDGATVAARINGKPLDGGVRAVNV